MMSLSVGMVRAWWLAVVATIMTAGLLVLAWANLVVPLVLALAAVLVTVVRRLRHGRARAAAHPVDLEPEPALLSTGTRGTDAQ